MTDVGIPKPMRWRPLTTKVSSPKRVVGPGVAVSHALAGALAALRRRAASRLPETLAIARVQERLCLPVCNATRYVALHNRQYGVQ